MDKPTMRNWSTSILLVMALGLPPASAQEPGAKTIVRLDPALDQIVAPDAKLEKLADGLGYTEPGVWLNDAAGGYWVFTDMVANTINRWTEGGGISVVLDHADWTKNPALRPDKSRVGPNGVTADREGRVIFCAEGDRAIVRLEKDGKRTVLADRFEGKRFNSPNDIVIRSDGALYFTDPTGGGRFRGYEPELDLPYQGVFLLKDGKVQLLIRDMTRPNGIAISPDEKYLYVNDATSQLIMRYDLQRDGTVSNGRVWVDMRLAKAPGDPDGMKVDKQGNVYTNGPGGIWIISSDGRHLGSIVPPVHSPGMIFGDRDGRTMYLAAGASLYRIRLKVAGVGRPKSDKRKREAKDREARSGSEKRRTVKRKAEAKEEPVSLRRGA